MHVYCITNKTNLKIYVGRHNGNNLQKYLNDKARKAIKCSGKKPPLYAAICKYGQEAFEITSLVRPIDEHQMDELEKFFIRTLESQNKEIGYNVFAGGDVGARGLHQSEEHRNKIGAKSRGRKITEETREKMRIAALNRSPEVRENMSKAQQGKKLKPEQIAALRAGFENMSDEARERMVTGYKKVDFSNRSEEHCRKISEALKGKPLSAETKAKLSAVRRGRKISQLQKDAISKAFTSRMTPEERSAFARRANEIRWGKKPTP